MGTDKSETLDGRWLAHVKAVGFNFERLEQMCETFERGGIVKLKRVSYKRNTDGWLVVVTADVDGKSVVQFATVPSIGASGGKLVAMLQQPIWKEDRFSVPAPHPLTLDKNFPIDKAPKK